MRKQTKPEVYLDHYLETLGLWRKPVARDGLCLFRAVSEQLFSTQMYHTNLYEACKIVFLHCGKDMETDWTETVVMEILSKMYRRDFLVYEEVGQLPRNVTQNCYKDKIVLCRTSCNQLDSVYPASFQQSSAICQSILYEILYRDVFKLNSELSEAVALIRDQNKKKISLLSNRFDDLPDTITRRHRESPTKFRERYVSRPTPPLPYRIAKALDPCIYRNVELDIWEEEKREQKRESQEHRDKFAPGDKCQVILEGERYCGHIQEICNADNTALVFIEELGEKRSVAVSCLKICPFARHSLYARHKSQKHKQILPVSPPAKPYYPECSQVPVATAAAATVYPSHYPTTPLPVTVAADLDFSHNCDNQAYTFGQAYGLVDTRMTNLNLNNPCVRMDNSCIQGNNLQNAKTNLNQYASTMLQQYNGNTAAMHQAVAAQQAGGYMYGPMVPQNMGGAGTTGYACICVPYLESIAVKDVNINSHPSQDMAGKDLPEMNTLRFFYNFGVENYRSISQPTWPEQGSMVPGTPDLINGNMAPQYALPPPPLPLTSSPTSDTNAATTHPPMDNHSYQASNGCEGASSYSTTNNNNNTSGSPVLKPSKGDKGDDSHDSGCDSDSASGITHDDSFKESEMKVRLKATSMELEQKIDSYIAKDDVEIMEAESAGAAEAATSPDCQTQPSTRTKKPRKYYMYGNHKLIKPIKDIPPRFLSLLQSSSTERARCEGEPIIVAVVPHRWNHYKHHAHITTAAAATNIAQYNGFNPEAKCFIPNQTTQSLMQDPSIIACSTGSTTSQTTATVDPYQVTPSQDAASYSYSTYGSGVPMYVTSPLYTPQTNPGAGNATFHSSAANPGDGSKLSMPASLLTGPSCPSYPPSMPYPMYYAAGHGPYAGTQTIMQQPAAGVQGAVAYAPAYHQSQAFGMQPPVTQVPAV